MGGEGLPSIYVYIYIYMYARPPPQDLPFGGLVSLVQVLMTIHSFYIPIRNWGEMLEY